MTTTRLEIFGIPLSTGPTLVYVHSDHDTVTLIDRKAVDSDLRERAICRALLVTALALLDAREPSLGCTTRGAE